MAGWKRYVTIWRVISGVLLIGLVLALDAFWWEPSSLAVVHHQIRLERGAALNGLHIAVIADLHAGAPYIDAAKVAKIVRLTNAEHPDLILLAGDYGVNRVVGRHEIAIEKIVALLKPLQARLGVYALIGNHDNWNGAPRIIEALEGAGIPVLENRAVTVHDGRRTFTLAGIGDAYTKHARPDEALAGIPHDATVLCVTHSPDVFPNLPDTCALTIAGHTHGGQVAFPLVGRLIVPSRYGQQYAAGLIVENGRTLFVTTGIGTSILPVRFRVRPEITILDLDVHG